AVPPQEPGRLLRSRRHRRRVPRRAHHVGFVPPSFEGGGCPASDPLPASTFPPEPESTAPPPSAASHATTSQIIARLSLVPRICPLALTASAMVSSSLRSVRTPSFHENAR